jgi:shikimate kinase
MGAGKSTTGQQLAKVLNKQFVDADKEIERSTGARISLIFELEGEAGFRRREKEMLQKLCERHDIVLATGGGVILDPDNRAQLRGKGFVIYLQAPIDYLVQRTARDRGRPLLQTGDPRARFEELMREREPLYTEAADIIVTTDKRSPRYVVKEILRRLAEL